MAEELGRTRIGWEMRFDSEEDCGRVLPYAPRCNEENFDRLEAELDRGRTAEIAAIIRGWHDALERRDLDAMIGGYAADAVIFDVKPPWTIAGPRALRQMWEACLPFFPEDFRIETQDLAVHRSGDLAVAHWVQRIVVERDPAHPAAQTCLRATVTLRRDGDCWLSVHDHVSVPFGQ
ncbi:MAG: nuclear transport factor 2 family protein [Verrucomicrobiales bacterium]